MCIKLVQVYPLPIRYTLADWVGDYWIVSHDGLGNFTAVQGAVSKGQEGAPYNAIRFKSVWADNVDRV